MAKSCNADISENHVFSVVSPWFPNEHLYYCLLVPHKSRPINRLDIWNSLEVTGDESNHAARRCVIFSDLVLVHFFRLETYEYLANSSVFILRNDLRNKDSALIIQIKLMPTREISLYNIVSKELNLDPDSFISWEILSQAKSILSCLA
jgi:hypothetical protein